MGRFRANELPTRCRYALLGALAFFLTPLATISASAQIVITADSTAPTVFRDVRVFDGVRVLPLATVVIEGDRITQNACANGSTRGAAPPPVATSTLDYIAFSWKLRRQPDQVDAAQPIARP
jgi:hypothetical protein